MNKLTALVQRSVKSAYLDYLEYRLLVAAEPMTYNKQFSQWVAKKGHGQRFQSYYLDDASLLTVYSTSYELAAPLFTKFDLTETEATEVRPVLPRTVGIHNLLTNTVHFFVLSLRDYALKEHLIGEILQQPMCK